MHWNQCCVCDLSLFPVGVLKYGGDSDGDVGVNSLPVSGAQFMTMLNETAPFYNDSNSQGVGGLAGMGVVPADPMQQPLLAGDYLVAQPRKVRTRGGRERDSCYCHILYMLFLGCSDTYRLC